MPEFTSLEAPTGKGIPSWMVIGGAVAIVAGVVVLISKNSSSGTTAAGTSINAGLGSIQEGQQNLLGTIQANQITNSNAFAGIGAQIQQSETAILGAFAAQGTALTAQIQTAADTVNQNTNQNNQGVMSAISDALAKLLQGQNAVTQSIQGGIAAGNSQLLDAINTDSNGVITSVNTSRSQIITQMQASESSLLSSILPQIQQLTALQQQGNAANSSQIQALQQSIMAALNNEQTAFNASFAGLSQQVGQVQLQVGNLAVPLNGIFSRVMMPTTADFRAQPQATQNAYLGVYGDYATAAAHWVIDAGNAVNMFYQQHPEYGQGANGTGTGGGVWGVLFGNNGGV